MKLYMSALGQAWRLKFNSNVLYLGIYKQNISIPSHLRVSVQRRRGLYFRACAPYLSFRNF